MNEDAEEFSRSLHTFCQTVVVWDGVSIVEDLGYTPQAVIYELGRMESDGVTVAENVQIPYWQLSFLHLSPFLPQNRLPRS